MACRRDCKYLKILLKSKVTYWALTGHWTFQKEGQHKKEHIVLERSARLNLDLKLWRRRRIVLKEKMMFVGGKGQPILMITCKSRTHPDNYLQKAGPLGWSFSNGRLNRVIICKRPANPYDQLQKADPSGWSQVKVWPIRMITCKRLVYWDDLLQKAGSSGSSFVKAGTFRWSLAKGWPIGMINCKRLPHWDDHLQKAGSSG